MLFHAFIKDLCGHHQGWVAPTGCLGAAGPLNQPSTTPHIAFSLSLLTQFLQANSCYSHNSSHPLFCFFTQPLNRPHSKLAKGILLLYFNLHCMEWSHPKEEGYKFIALKHDKVQIWLHLSTSNKLLSLTLLSCQTGQGNSRWITIAAGLESKSVLWWVKMIEINALCV